MIECTQNDDLWTITLNRPDKANALTPEMLQSLIDVVEQADGAAKALVLTGAGKVFCAGADLDAARAGLATSPLWEQLSGAIARLPCMTIAALNGTLAGGAFGMALACDIRIAVPHAKFFYPVMKLGYLPQPSDPERLTQLVGPARAKMIIMAGQKITAEQALDWGLIEAVVAPEELLNFAHSLGTDALSSEPQHVAGIKALFRA